jgi:PiT family inorganic phosphate transporter
LLSYSHGGNDAQKTMGVVVGLLVSVQGLFANEQGWLHALYLPDNKTVPYWLEIGAYSAISLGTLFGGWRIVHTMGQRITKLRPVGGFCAETGGAAAILIATHFGIPVSTTHTITGSIVGVGATQARVGGSVGDRRSDCLGMDPHDSGRGGDVGDRLLHSFDGRSDVSRYRRQ